ncbi:ATP-binding cassette domain-containing protein [candidate division KSB1 bacterium]|nr:ATP-binding cassette domain-containing protein [candidate division KSB1 bacterium]
MIEIDHISFDYQHDNGTQRVLSDIALTIQPGEALALMGANGSGKSTLVKCLNGLLLPSSGKVRVDGMDTAEEKNLPAIRRRVGMIFQNPDNQIVSTTVEREVAFGLENLGLTYEAMHHRVEEMLERMKLMPLRHKSPHYLSGGEKQRLALASVLAMQPQYLILDEPTSLLDPLSRKDIISYVKNLHSQPARESRETMSTLFVTQFSEEALFFNRLLILAAGRVVYDGIPSAIFSDLEKMQEWGLESPANFHLRYLMAGQQAGSDGLNLSDL